MCVVGLQMHILWLVCVCVFCSGFMEFFFILKTWNIFIKRSRTKKKMNNENERRITKANIDFNISSRFVFRDVMIHSVIVIDES